jgi:spore coat polysaccharide biosynthesis protein SpsF (cytidylyltransferase family)
MRIVGIIVARNGSTRVPGKSMIRFMDQPMIWHIIQIAKKIGGLSEICLATSDLSKDDKLAELARQEGITVSRGDAEKVLDRVYAAAEKVKADAVVYIGGDCPFLDPAIVSDAVKVFIEQKCDYLNNYEPPTFPGGMDINVVSFSALQKAYLHALAPSQRIHAFSYLTFHSAEFIIKNYAISAEYSDNLSTYHWSLDYPEDVNFIHLVMQKLKEACSEATFQNMLSLIENDCEVKAMHTKLIKPNVSHAFFSSPGIMKDINADIVFLSENAIEAILSNRFSEAENYYREIANIASKLSTIS